MRWVALLTMSACAAPQAVPRFWSELPVRLALSSELSDCHIRTYHEAADFLERKVGQNLFELELVPPDSLAASGLPPYGVVAVVPGPRSTPEALSDTRIFFDGAEGRLHSAVITAGLCSLRSAAHEESHALGLEHAPESQRLNLMLEAHDERATRLTPAQIDAITSGQYRLAITKPKPRSSSVQATRRSP